MARNRLFCKIFIIVNILVLLYYIVTQSNTNGVKYTITVLPLQSSSELWISEVPLYTDGNTDQVENTSVVPFDCHTKSNVPRNETRGKFVVMYNYITARRTARCNASLTFSTHTDLTYLDNLEPLMARWQGPVSLALYAPGTDFPLTLSAIAYARECLSQLIREYVTFHVYFDAEFRPAEMGARGPPNCSGPAPWTIFTRPELFRSRNGMVYPVNVGRNVAWESALTHYVLPCDIELYPSPGLIQGFLAMVRRKDEVLLTAKHKVFPLPVFEVEQGKSLPQSKNQLVSMLKNGSAITFHRHMCYFCHEIPKAEEWVKANVSSSLGVVHVAKRQGAQMAWEPFFIGTHSEPLFDERLSWEGKYDKMTQAYAMCLLDYEFLIMDNAFLVHRPGIKRYKYNPVQNKIAVRTWFLMQLTIRAELEAKYGYRSGCFL